SPTRRSSDLEGVRLPDGSELTTVSVADSNAANLSVTPIALQRSTFSNQQRITVTGGAANPGPAAVQGVALTLEVGGRGVQTKRVNVEPGGSASATFEPVTVAERNLRAAGRLRDNALHAYTIFHF